MLSSLKDDHRYLFELESHIDYDDDVKKDILSALDGKKPEKDNFKKKYPKIPVDKISKMPKDSQSDHQLKVKSGLPFPVFGRHNIITTLKHLDEKVNHQGIDPILKELKKEKIVFFDIHEGYDRYAAIDITRANLTKIYRCSQCKIVEDLKARGSTDDNGTPKIFTFTNEKDITEALEYADTLHTGCSI